jgi:hypothetical protein
LTGFTSSTVRWISSMDITARGEVTSVVTGDDAFTVEGAATPVRTVAAVRRTSIRDLLPDEK